MNKAQAIKILQVMLIATALMFAFEVLFSFDGVTEEQVEKLLPQRY